MASKIGLLVNLRYNLTVGIVKWFVIPSIAACESVIIQIDEFIGYVKRNVQIAINSALVEEGHSWEPQSNLRLFWTMNHPEPIIDILSDLERSRLTCLLEREPSV